MIKKLDKLKLHCQLIFSDELLEKTNLSKIDLNYLVSLYSSHLMLPSLYCKLKSANLDKKLPKELNKYLNEIYELNYNRNSVLLSELKQISKILDTNNIEYVFLKGSANLALGIYKNIGERMIGDIDILVENKNLEKTYKIMEKAGYIPKEKGYFRNIYKHLPRQINKNKLFAIEIHNEKLIKKRVENFNGKELLCNRLKINGVYVPNLKNQFIHNIYNFQINDYGNSKLSFSLRSYYDIICIVRKDLKIYDKIKPDSIIKNYFTISKILEIDLGNNSIERRKIVEIRFLLKFKFWIYKKIEKSYFYLLRKIIWLPYQINEFFINKYYRQEKFSHIKNFFFP